MDNKSLSQVIKNSGEKFQKCQLKNHKNLEMNLVCVDKNCENKGLLCKICCENENHVNHQILNLSNFIHTFQQQSIKPIDASEQKMTNFQQQIGEIKEKIQKQLLNIQKSFNHKIDIFIQEYEHSYKQDERLIQDLVGMHSNYKEWISNLEQNKFQSFQEAQHVTLKLVACLRQSHDAKPWLIQKIEQNLEQIEHKCSFYECLKDYMFNEAEKVLKFIDNFQSIVKIQLDQKDKMAIDYIQQQQNLSKNNTQLQNSYHLPLDINTNQNQNFITQPMLSHKAMHTNQSFDFQKMNTLTGGQGQGFNNTQNIPNVAAKCKNKVTNYFSQMNTPRMGENNYTQEDQQHILPNHALDNLSISNNNKQDPNTMIQSKRQNFNQTNRSRFQSVPLSPQNTNNQQEFDFQQNQSKNQPQSVLANLNYNTGNLQQMISKKNREFQENNLPPVENGFGTIRGQDDENELVLQPIQPKIKSQDQRMFKNKQYKKQYSNNQPDFNLNLENNQKYQQYQSQNSNNSQNISAGQRMQQQRFSHRTNNQLQYNNNMNKKLQNQISSTKRSANGSPVLAFNNQKSSNYFTQPDQNKYYNRDNSSRINQTQQEQSLQFDQDHNSQYTNPNDQSIISGTYQLHSNNARQNKFDDQQGSQYAKRGDDSVSLPKDQALYANQIIETPSNIAAKTQSQFFSTKNSNPNKEINLFHNTQQQNKVDMGGFQPSFRETFQDNSAYNSSNNISFTNGDALEKRLGWKAHQNEVKCLVFIEGNQLCSGGADGMVKIWDKYQGKLINVLEGHTNQIECLIYNNFSKILISGSIDKSIRIWKAIPNWQCVSELKAHQSTVKTLSMLQNNELASGSLDGTVKIWNLYKGTCIASMKSEDGGVNSLISTSITELIAGASKQLIKFDLEKHQIIKSVNGHRSCVTSLQIQQKNLNEQILISGSLDQTIRLWEPKNLIPLKHISEKHPVYTMAFIAQYNYLAVGVGGIGGEGYIGVWDMNLLKKVKQYGENNCQVNSIVWDFEGEQLFSAHQNQLIQYGKINMLKQIQ